MAPLCVVLGLLDNHFHLHHPLALGLMDGYKAVVALVQVPLTTSESPLLSRFILAYVKFHKVKSKIVAPPLEAEAAMVSQKTVSYQVGYKLMTLRYTSNHL